VVGQLVLLQPFQRFPDALEKSKTVETVPQIKGPRHPVEIG
jgi:hypothetical protein